MIFGIGTDIVEVERIGKQILKDHGFKEKIFASGEIVYCDSKKRFSENYAARFAGKEAFLKALGTGLRDGLSFNEIEILNDKLGKPYINLYGKTKEFVEGKGIKNIHISLSHEKNVATAKVILET
ncbi:holo-ACP synthase [Bacteroidota bacterium]